MSLPEVVQRRVLTIQATEGEPEDNATNARQDSHGTIVPHEPRVHGQRYHVAVKSVRCPSQ